MRLAVMAATHLLPIIFLKNTNYKDFLMETCKGNTTIGVFIDGGYYAKINEALMGKAGNVRCRPAALRKASSF